jgi:serine protease Do
MNKYLKSAGLLIVVAVFHANAGIYPSAEQTDIYKARDKVLGALVHIQPVVKNFETGEMEKQQIVGSGVIFRTDGYVVTNYHVAGKSDRIFCTLPDKEVVPATYIGGDPLTDLAVIKLDLTKYSGKLIGAEFGNSDSLEVGQFVLAMGSPLALSRSVSAGVISTRDRYFSSDVRLPTGEPTGMYNLWIQTDAAINPGNSGGPLLDLNGRVVGINSRATTFANNLGFAIPVNIVKEVTTEILAHGKVTRSWIGVHCQALQELEQYFGTGRNSGVLVASIDAGSPAEEAGLMAGDIITEVNRTPVSARFVEELPAFYSLIAKKKPGAKLTLSVLRQEKPSSLTLVTRELGELQGEDFECKNWGFTLKGITAHMQVEHQLPDTLGVFVAGVKRSSSSDEGGLRPDDVITKVDTHPITGLADFVRHCNSAVSGEKALLTIRRNGATRFVIVKHEPKKSGGAHE